MLLELKHWTYTGGNTEVCSIQGYPVKGIMVSVTREEVETGTYVIIRTPQQTLCERLTLEQLHTLSDFGGGNVDEDAAASLAWTFINLGLVALADSEEMTIQVETLAAPGSSTYIGVYAVIADLPEHDEVAYQYKLLTDTAFSVDACSALYVFGTAAIASDGALINCKMGDDTFGVTARAACAYANLLGKLKSDQDKFGVLFENGYGQPVTVNTSLSGATFIARRVVQQDAVRAAQATARLARVAQRKLRKIDAQSLKASA